MKIGVIFIFTISSLFWMLLVGCNPEQVNSFTVKDDQILGKKIRDQILNDPTITVLDKNYSHVYGYLNNMRNAILGSGKLQHSADFDWELYVIKDDSTINAFCAPGGYFFIYSGLLKYIDKNAMLAGVLAHEMAHADLRHPTNLLTQQFGLASLINFNLGKNQNQLGALASTLAFLKFNKTEEEITDKNGVISLCSSNYNAAGEADFFSKVISDSTLLHHPALFLNSHPDPGNRITVIKNETITQNCGAKTDDSTYAQFKSWLP